MTPHPAVRDPMFFMSDLYAVRAEISLLSWLQGLPESAGAVIEFVNGRPREHLPGRRPDPVRPPACLLWLATALGRGETVRAHVELQMRRPTRYTGEVPPCLRRPTNPRGPASATEHLLWYAESVVAVCLHDLNAAERLLWGQALGMMPATLDSHARDLGATQALTALEPVREFINPLLLPPGVSAGQLRDLVDESWEEVNRTLLARLERSIPPTGWPELSEEAEEEPAATEGVATAPVADGPRPPNLLRWQGQDHPIGTPRSRRLWQLLRALWHLEEGAARSYQSLIDARCVWEDVPNDATIRSAVTRLNTTLPPGYPWSYSVQGRYVVKVRSNC